MAAQHQPSFIEQARRRQIVEAAISVIAEVGYAAASFSRIAERAGISAGLISYHFENKADLVNSVATHITEQLHTVIVDRTTDSPSFRHALVAMVEAQVDFFATHREEIAALGSIRADARDPDTGQRIAESQRRTAIGQLEEFYLAADAAGESLGLDARVLAVSTLGALEAVPGELATHPDMDPFHYGRQLATLLLRAIGTAPNTVRKLVDSND